MNSAFERVISESLEELERGRSIDEILAVYPDQADKLRPILETAQGMSSLRVAHSIGAQAQSLDHFLAAAKAMQSSKAATAGPAIIFLRRFALAMSMAVLILFLLTAAVTISAQSAVPGDALYSTKRTIEDIRASLVRNPDTLDNLTAGFNQERIKEIEKLAAGGRSARDLEFTGKVDSVDSSSIVIAGIAIDIGEQIEMGDLPEIGDLVLVVVDIQEGNVVATKIITLSRSEEAPEPLPKPTATPQGEEELEPATPVPDTSPEGTAEPTGTPRPLPTVTVEAGDLVPPETTTTAVGEEDDGDDEEEEDSDSNSGSGDEGSDSGDEEGDESSEDDVVKFTGVVEAIGEDSWTISGQVVTTTPDTEIKDVIEVGDEVKVEVATADDGSLVAHEIELFDDDDAGETGDDDPDEPDDDDSKKDSGDDDDDSGKTGDDDPDEPDDDDSEKDSDDDDDEKPDDGD